MAIGERLTGLLRPGDTLARLAGDEFAVVLTQLQHPGEAEVVARKIVASPRKMRAIPSPCRSPIRWNSSALSVSPGTTDAVESCQRVIDRVKYSAIAFVRSVSSPLESSTSCIQPLTSPSIPPTHQ